MINLRIGDKVSGQVVKSVRVGYVIDINAPSEALLPKENLGKKQLKLGLGDQVQDLIVMDVDHAARGYEKIILSGKEMVKLWPGSPDRSPQTSSPQMSPGTGAGTRTPPEYHGIGARAMAPPLPGARPPGDPPPPRGAQSPASQASEDDQPSWATHLFRDNERPHSAPMPTANTKIARAREAEEQRSAEWRPAPPDFLLAPARRGGAAMPPASEGRGMLQPGGARAGMDGGRGGAKRAQRGAVEEDAEEELSAPARPPPVPAMPSGQGRHSPPQSPPSEAQEERSMRRWPQVPDDRGHSRRSPQHTRGSSPPGSPELMSENDVESVGIGYYTDHLDFDTHRGPSRQGGRASRDWAQRQAAGRRRWEVSSPSSALQSPQGGSPRGSYEGVPYPAGQGVQTPVTGQVVRELRMTLLETAKERGIPAQLLGKVLASLNSLQEDLEELSEQKIAEGARKPATWASRPSSSSARARGSTSARAEPRPRSSQSATGQGAEGSSSRGATPAPKRVASAPGLLPGSAPVSGRQRSQQVQPQQGRVGPRGGRRSAHEAPADAGGGAAGRQAGKVRTARQPREVREPPREPRGQPRDSRDRESRERESELLDRITNESGTPVNDLSVGEEANGTVVDIVPNLGIFFDVGAQKLGKMLKRSMGRDLPEDLRVGDKVEGLRIDSVDKANQRFTLSGEGVEFGEPIYLRKEVERARLQGAKRHALH